MGLRQAPYCESRGPHRRSQSIEKRGSRPWQGQGKVNIGKLFLLFFLWWDLCHRQKLPLLSALHCSALLRPAPTPLRRQGASVRQVAGPAPLVPPGPPASVTLPPAPGGTEGPVVPSGLMWRAPPKVPKNPPPTPTGWGGMHPSFRRSPRVSYIRSRAGWDWAPAISPGPKWRAAPGLQNRSYPTYRKIEMGLIRLLFCCLLLYSTWIHQGLHHVVFLQVGLSFFFLKSQSSKV